MPVIEISVTPEGKKRLTHYAETALAGGHRGSSGIEIPDEQILAHKIRAAGDLIELSVRECRLLLHWFGESTGDGRFLLPEDADLITGIREAIETYLKRLERQYRSERGDADLLANVIGRILPVGDAAASKIADAVMAPAAKVLDPTDVREEERRDGNAHSPDRQPFLPERISLWKSVAADIKTGLKRISGMLSRHKSPGPVYQYESMDDLMARSRRLAKKMSKIR